MFDFDFLSFHTDLPPPRFKKHLIDQRRNTNASPFTNQELKGKGRGSSAKDIETPKAALNYDSDSVAVSPNETHITE
jgi:hypothetical protein